MTWQISQAVFPKSENMSEGEKYHVLWCEQYPDRIMRIRQVIAYDTREVFIVCSHERVGK